MRVFEFRTATPVQVQQAAAESECAMRVISKGKPGGQVREDLYTNSDSWSGYDLRVIADTCHENETAHKQIAGLKKQADAE